MHSRAGLAQQSSGHVVIIGANGATSRRLKRNGSNAAQSHHRGARSTKRLREHEPPTMRHQTAAGTYDAFHASIASMAPPT